MKGEPVNIFKSATAARAARTQRELTDARVALALATNVSLSKSPTVGNRDNTQHIDSMGWLTGLEPATTGITIQDSTN